MMDHRYRTIWLLAAGLAGLATSAVASAQNTMVAQCAGGTGADFFLSDVTQEDASVVYGLDAPTGDGAVLVIDGPEGTHWSRQSRSSIDKDCGGDGDDQISLFAPVQPRDGTWSLHMDDHRMIGCSARIAGAAKAAVAKMLGQTNTHAFNFQKPFHPQPLMAGDKDARWAQTGANSWQSEIAHNGSGAMTMDVVVDAEVISPTQIHETSTFTIRMSPQLVKIMGGTGNCRSIATATLSWVK